MNIANPCKIFLVGAAMLAAFAVRADGTLPLPLEDSDLPFAMGGSGVETTTSSTGQSTRDLVVTMTISSASTLENTTSPFKSRCSAGTSKFYTASGKVIVGSDTFVIEGVCAPQNKESSPARQVIATTKDRSTMQFNGQFVGVPSALKSFVGNAVKVDSAHSTPLTGTEVRFELYSP